MAVRIPTYERHVALDAGAQTMPRFTADLSIGRGLKEAGSELSRVAAHWKAKQDGFDKMQLRLADQALHEQINSIIMEETFKYNPLTERPGVLHDRINARVAPLIEQFKANAPTSQKKEAEAAANFRHQQSSTTSAGYEQTKRNQVTEKEINREIGVIMATQEKNPDGHKGAVERLDQLLKDTAVFAGFTPEQIRQIRKAGLTSIHQSTIKGYAAQGRNEEGQEFNQQFIKDRQAEQVLFEKEQRARQEKTGGTPTPGAPQAPPKGDRTGIYRDEEPVPLPKARPEPVPGGFAEPLEPEKPTKMAPDQRGEVVPGEDRRMTAGEERPVEDTGYNAKRIAEIDAKPQIARMLEQVAVETGMDPNMLKVAASIESSGNPKAKTGDHVGLFQLTKAEMGMHGGGDREDARQNALAFVSILQRNAVQLKKEIGREPTAEELYLSHNQGVGGTIAHIKNPDQPAWKTMLATTEGKEKGEAWAKAAVKGNIPGDVLRRMYGGDETKVTSSDLVAIKGTQVAGGDVDFAVAMRRDEAQPQTQPKPIVVASADGNYVNDASPAFVGGMNVGGPLPASTYANLPGYRSGGLPQPGGVVSFGERGAHGYTRGGINVAPWLVDSVKEASKTLPPGYRAEVISTVDPRKTGTVWHPTGRAIDIQIYDDKGNKVPNIGDPSKPGWKVYEDMAAAAHAIAQDKHGQKLTWGGHFNTGTPYDRMHFQVGGDSARKFTPEQVEAGRQLIKVAGALPTSDTVAGIEGPGDYWSRQGQSGQTFLEGSGQKASSLKRDMSQSLKQAINDDIHQIRTKGTQATLSPEQQKYYKTDKLSYEFISNQLGTGAAIKWSEDRQWSEKFYQHTRNMGEMSNRTIRENLAQLATTIRNPVDERRYKEVDTEARKIMTARDKDAAGETMKYSASVRQAYEEMIKDPNNPLKTKALIDARYKAMNDWGIEPHRQSPITNDEARRMVTPLKDLADPDIDRAAAGKKVAQNVYDLANRDQATAEAALRKVLEVGNVQKEIAANTARALQDIRVAAEADLAKVHKETASGAVASTMKQVHAYDTMYGMPGLENNQPLVEEMPRKYTAADRSRISFGEHGAFDPTSTFIPRSQMEALIKNKDNPVAVEIFDQQYGGGASDHVIRGGQVIASDPNAPAPNRFYVDPKVDYPNYVPPATTSTFPPEEPAVSWPEPLVETTLPEDEEKATQEPL